MDLQYNEAVNQAVQDVMLRSYAYSAAWFLLGLWTGWRLKQRWLSKQEVSPAIRQEETGKNGGEKVRVEGVREPVKAPEAKIVFVQKPVRTAKKD